MTTVKEITIGYVREKLGEKGQKMTDQEIASLLSTIRLLCSKTIDEIIEEKQAQRI